MSLRNSAICGAGNAGVVTAVGLHGVLKDSTPSRLVPLLFVAPIRKKYVVQFSSTAPVLRDRAWSVFEVPALNGPRVVTPVSSAGSVLYSKKYVAAPANGLPVRPTPCTLVRPFSVADAVVAL